MSNNQKETEVAIEDDMPETEADASNDQTDSAPRKASLLSEEKDRKLASKITGRTRFVATVPATGMLIASVVLAIGTLIALIISSYEFIVGEISLHDLTIEYVEHADAFLLAVALYIMSIGLTTLFVSENIPLPLWLEFHDFDDLKERLTSVIVVMIGVFFLGHVLKNAQGIDTLWIGLGCAAVIIALSVFMRTVFKSEE